MNHSKNCTAETLALIGVDELQHIWGKWGKRFGAWQGHGSASAPTIDDNLYLINWQSAVCREQGIKKDESYLIVINL